MKKVVGLFLVILVSTVSVFANNNGKHQRGERGGDPSKRYEKIVADLNLNEKQAADFQKIESDYRTKVKAERDKANTDRKKVREQMNTLRTQKDSDIKKLLTEEQYQKYQQFTQKKQNRQGKPGKSGRNAKQGKPCKEKKGTCDSCPTKG